MILLNPSDRPSGSKIFFLIKFFSEKDHARQFLDGNLFMRRMSYFQREEDSGGRWDETEGVGAWWQKKGMKIRLCPPGRRSINITEKDLAGPVYLSPLAFDNIYIYCMYAIHIEETRFSQVNDMASLAGLEATLKIDPRCLRFGPHAVVVHRLMPFQERITQAIKIHSFGLRANLVHYYDNDVFNGIIAIKDIPFRKQKRFSYQREFRICVRNNDLYPMKENLTLKVGSLSDVATYIPSEQLLSAFKLDMDS
ncbi:hypothetical protein [Komagataeibacter oboediens]|uniref:hypothetical protein n=1 Tax=Komagataeibacter oboediens TaxID=65958 RepID=UPI0019033EA6|nr:hypothetical protein [Komagataeibacter oboediens]GCE79380.1 hypothetical protein MSKU3_0855 [Komagataeibacter oboediens]